MKERGKSPIVHNVHAIHANTHVATFSHSHPHANHKLESFMYNVRKTSCINYIGCTIETKHLYICNVKS